MNAKASPPGPRLGVDIGRVIIAGPAHSTGADTASPGGNADTAFFDGDEATMLATPEVPDAVEALARLAQRFDRRVWLVSKCGPRVQARTLRWLDAHDFYRRTGVSPDRVRFCRKRADKRRYCQRFALTHFVDDRPQVHAAIRGTVEHQYFFGPQRLPVPGYGQHAPTWADAERLIGYSLAG